jgi:hypothetical protein
MTVIIVADHDLDTTQPVDRHDERARAAQDRVFAEHNELPGSSRRN